MSTQINKIGILAGEGKLPLYLYNYCRNSNIPVVIVMFLDCSYEGWFDDATPKLMTRIEKVGAIFDFLDKHGVKTVVMIGGLNRPSLKKLRPDWRGIKTLGRIVGSFFKGDDNLLRCLRAEIENEGFSVRGIDYYLRDLTSPAGILSRTHPDDAQMTLIEKGLDAAKFHGLRDQGQCVLVHTDDSVSYEKQDGTAALICRDGRAGSILVKVTKPQQDPDLDRPTVGLDTMICLKDKGCAGLVIQADSVLMVDKEEMIDFANANRMFLMAEGVT